MRGKAEGGQLHMPGDVAIPATGAVIVDVPGAGVGAGAGAGGGVGAGRDAELEGRIAEVGSHLLRAVGTLLESVPRPVAGPIALAKTLGVDKVLTSRVMKALRSEDPIGAVQAMPGPEPLRRMIRAAQRRGAGDAAVGDALAAVERFEALIRERFGDRSLLDSILSAYVPEARREFELRRKQAAFKAISQLKGAQADVLMATVILQPSARTRAGGLDEDRAAMIDVVWIHGLIGLHRIRPGVTVKLASRRLNTPASDPARCPRTLEGEPIVDARTSLLLEPFCSTPLPTLNVTAVPGPRPLPTRAEDVSAPPAGPETVFYTLGDAGFGSENAVDLVFAEVNRGELPRYLPVGSNRRNYSFAEVSTPSKVLQFDVLVHEDLFAGQTPELRLYDTSFEGVANPNHPAREIDRLDLAEVIEPLGVIQRGDGALTRARSGDVPRYAPLLKHVCDRAGLDASKLRCYRCRIDYPLYGSQVVMCFRAEER